MADSGEDSNFVPLLNESNFEEESESGFMGRETRENKPEDEDILFKEHPYDQAGWLSKLFFSWAHLVIQFGQKNRFGPNTLGQTYEGVRTEHQKERILKTWNYYKDTSKHPILRSIWTSYKKEFIIAMLIQFVRVLMQIAQPLLITRILNFIEAPAGEDGGIALGIILVVSYFITEVIQNIFWMQSLFLQNILGVRCSHGMISIIYEKSLKISSATNKEYSQGEIINFIEVDVSKIEQVAWELPMVSRYPIQLIFSITFLFYFFGYSLFVTIGVGLLTAVINFIITK